MCLDYILTARVNSDSSFDANFEAAAEESLWDSVKNSVLKSTDIFAAALLSSYSNGNRFPSILGRVWKYGSSIIVVMQGDKCRERKFCFYIHISWIYPTSTLLPFIHSLTACQLVYEFHHGIQLWKRLKLDCSFKTPTNTNPTCFGVIYAILRELYTKI
jgi:hypothetical protein